MLATEGPIMERRAHGFTLLELVVAVAVLAVCGTVAIPALGRLVELQRTSAVTTALTTQMQVARMAAITYRQPAVLCPSASGTSCDGPIDWSGGWMVFLDADGNRRPDSDEEIIRVGPAPARRTLRVLGTRGRPQLRYMPDGRSAGSNLTLSVCNRRGDLLRSVIVNNAGRPRVAQPVASTPCPG